MGTTALLVGSVFAFIASRRWRESCFYHHVDEGGPSQDTLPVQLLLSEDRDSSGTGGLLLKVFHTSFHADMLYVASIRGMGEGRQDYGTEYSRPRFRTNIIFLLQMCPWPGYVSLEISGSVLTILGVNGGVLIRRKTRLGQGASVGRKRRQETRRAPRAAEF